MPTIPIHGTTSHIGSPHSTQVEGQVDQQATISSTMSPTSPTGADQSRRLSISSPKMLFSDLYKSTKVPLAKLRHHSQPAPAVVLDYDPDLVSKDKYKKKFAVERLLAEKVRNDWQFTWPPEPTNPVPGHVGAKAKDQKDQDQGPSVEESGSGDDDDDAVSVYSTVTEDLANFRPRAEWLSDMPPDNDDEGPPLSPSAYRFDNPDAVGDSVKRSALAKSAKRRHEVRAEMEWNDGLACFNARRDAWTGAKAARVRPKPTTSIPTSPAGKRLSFWHMSSSPLPPSPPESVALSPSATRTSGDTTAVCSSDADVKETKPKEDTSTYPVEVLIPIPPPILPANIPMRVSVVPNAYPALYNKLVLESAAPLGPVNLSHVIRACVTGWKRDGEWSGRAAELPAVWKNKVPEDKRRESKRMSFSFLGGRRQSSTAGGDPISNTAENNNNTSRPEKEKEDHATGKASMRRSIQRVLGFGHERTTSNASQQGNMAA
ncbi:uncharacterized protein GGS25DRAFT_207144 [Hypoxylon fragiforme]|uniref:uncharacterized protein n=1 Tax=Hypoxylon fragiforme TaxID=63214 RepID=UPI0020C730D1|nr:uncharacterized protein GGS25DRAFT_207144 [Hypoxylon fragiforme]KAI2611718.1 hypothetical protein GGS25DRAFT_207144 [Hypoxylon fragiforme]